MAGNKKQHLPRDDPEAKSARAWARRIAWMLGLSGALSLVLAVVYVLDHQNDIQEVPFEGARALTVVEELCKRGGRHLGAEGREDRVATLRGLVDQVSEQSALQRFTVTDRTSGERHELANIIGRINPSAKRRLLIGAHWDTRASSKRDEDPGRRTEPTPGANNGTSGVAVVLELARVLSAAGLRRVGVDVLLFDGREVGPVGAGDESQGARYFSARLGALYPSGPPELAVVLDMVGGCSARLRPEVLSQAEAPDLVRRIWSEAEEMGYSETFVTDGTVQVPHDHVALLRSRVPTALLIDYDYPFRHTTGDTPDRLCAEVLERVGRVLQQVVLSEETDGQG